MESLRRAVHSSSFGTPGGSLDGIRTDAFQSDSPFPKTIVVRAYAIDVVRESIPCGLDPQQQPAGAFPVQAADEPVRVFKQLSGDVVGFYDSTIYLCNLKVIHAHGKKWSSDNTLIDDAPANAHLATAFSGSDSFERTMQCNWKQGSFFIPRFAITDESSHREPEEFTAVFDYIHGRLVPVDWRPIRAAIVTSDGRANPAAGGASGIVDVQIITQRRDGVFLNTNTFIQKVVFNFAEFRIARGDIIGIILLDNLWHVFRAGLKVVGGPRELAHDIEFQLLDPLSTSDRNARATVTGFDNGVSPGGEIDVYNPPRGCGTGTYRFWGKAGCRGSAVYLRTGMFYKIIQLDCDDNESGPPEESASSGSSSTSMSSMSESSSSSTTCSSVVDAGGTANSPGRIG